MARRLIRKGHSCVVFNRSPQAVKELVKDVRSTPECSWCRNGDIRVSISTVNDAALP
jgi:3-hydroxyisobutyrate dehydrogenase-like beta-hydroxyacid dehydrogenase